MKVFWFMASSWTSAAEAFYIHPWWDAANNYLDNVEKQLG